MNLLIILLIVASVAAIAYNKKKKNKSQTDTAPVPEPVLNGVPDLPVGDWIYIDECVPKTTKHETNGGPDMVATLALVVSRKGTKPRFIGVTCGQDGVDKSHTIEVVKGLAINVPVYEGSQEYEAGQSELGEAIIAETKKGKLNIILGSPAGDLSWAIKNGAHHHNIHLWALLVDTWNADSSDGMPHYQREAMAASAAHVDRTIPADRKHYIRRPDYYYLIKTSNLPPIFRNTGAFIERNKKGLPGWAIANKAEIVNRNRQLNAGLGGSPLRIADVLATAAYCGIPWNDAGRIMSGIQHGLDIMRDRIAQGAVNTIEYTEVAPLEPVEYEPVDKSTFSIAKCKIKGSSDNPLTFAETAKITSFEVREYDHTVKHTKDGKWVGKYYEAGRMLDSCSCMVYYDRKQKSWVCWVFEYGIRGEYTRPKGWKSSGVIQKGDPIMFFDASLCRNGKWEVQEQRNERTNFVWTTAK